MKITAITITRNLFFATAVSALMLSSFGCSKSSNSTTTTTTTSTTPAITATINGTPLTLTVGTIKYSGGVFQLAGSAKSGVVTYAVVILVTASSAGTYTLSTSNTGYIGINNPTAYSYYTDVSHTGSITFTTLNTASGSHSASGSFNFVANETSPNPGANTANISTASFSNLTW